MVGVRVRTNSDTSMMRIYIKQEENIRVLYVCMFLEGLTSGTLWNYRLSTFFVRKSDENNIDHRAIGTRKNPTK